MISVERKKNGGSGGGGTPTPETSIKWKGLIVVDDVYGDDTTGEVDNLAKPYKTIEAAVAVYQDDYMIQVNSGTYLFIASLLTNIAASLNIHIDFKTGANVIGNILTPLFNTINSNQILHIYGNGYFSNAGTGAGASVFAVQTKIFGAEQIHSVNATPIALNWILIQNVNKLLSDNSYDLQVVNQDNKNGIDSGIVKNVNIGAEDSFLGIRIDSQIQTIKCLFENCSVVANGFPLFGNSINNNSVFKNCNFRVTGTNRRVVFAGGKLRFYDCNFENDSTSPTVQILGDGAEFTNCRLKNNSNGECIYTANPIKWNGVNYIQGRLNSQSDVNQYINGTIYTNQLPTQFGLQFWDMVLTQDVPTVGIDYFIDSPDGSTITYTIQPGDTRTEIINGLHAAWDAKAAELNNDFANFTPSSVDGPTVFYIKGTALSQDFTMSQTNGFVPGTTGADTFTTFGSQSLGFTTVGGNLQIDENLTL